MGLEVGRTQSPAATGARRRRTEDFGISFASGIAEGWVFGVPEAFRDQLDISLSVYVDKAATADVRRRMPVGPDGRPPVVYRQAWTRGSPPLLSFDIGHRFYAPAGAGRLAWGDALGVLEWGAAVVSASPDTLTGQGTVVAELTRYVAGRVAGRRTVSLSQAEFEALLRHGCDMLTPDV